MRAFFVLNRPVFGLIANKDYVKTLCFWYLIGNKHIDNFGLCPLRIYDSKLR